MDKATAIEEKTTRLRLARKTGAGLACLAAVATLLASPTVEAQTHHRSTSHHGTASTASAQAPTGHVNINTASAEELRGLPGIGPSKADAIVALRRRVHRFRRIEEVMRVRGIGRATFRRLRTWLTVDGPTTLSAPPSRHRSPTAAAHHGQGD